MDDERAGWRDRAEEEARARRAQDGLTVVWRRRQTRPRSGRVPDPEPIAGFPGHRHGQELALAHRRGRPQRTHRACELRRAETLADDETLSVRTALAAS